MKTKFKKRFARIRSKHPSHAPLRAAIPIDTKAVVRFGSTTEMPSEFIEINHKDVARISGNKLKMKQAFDEAGAQTAVWINPRLCTGTSGTTVANECAKLGFPIVAKHIFGSQGKGNTLIKSEEELSEYLQGKTVNNYIFEKFYNYSREYRLHVDAEGCFYACRKMLKSDTPAEERWHRHSDTSVWIVEENEMFQRPNTWDDIVEDCVAILNEIGADFLAFDVKVQSDVDSKGYPRDRQEYIIIEANSAPSLGDKGIEIYKKRIPQMIKRKTAV